MAVYIMGDTHYGACGDEEKLLCLQAKSEDFAIICGDAGFVWYGDDAADGRDKMVLDNGEVWKVVKGNMSCRGIKWSKCFIDIDIPYERVELDILPNRIYLSQNKEVYF